MPTSFENVWKLNQWETETQENILQTSKTIAIDSEFSPDILKKIAQCEEELNEITYKKEIIKNAIYRKYNIALDDFEDIAEEEGYNSTEVIIFEKVILETIETIPKIGEYIECGYEVIEAVFNQKREASLNYLRQEFRTKTKIKIDEMETHFKLKELDITLNNYKVNNNIKILELHEFYQKLQVIKDNLAKIIRNLPESEYLLLELLLSWMKGSKQFILGQYYSWEFKNITPTLEIKVSTNELKATRIINVTWLNFNYSQNLMKAIFKNKYFPLFQNINNKGEPGIDKSKLEKHFVGVKIKKIEYADEYMI